MTHSTCPRTTQSKLYTAESCHEIGRGWSIEAPASIPQEVVEEIHQTIVEATDHPSDTAIDEILTDAFRRGEFPQCSLEDLRGIRISTDVVHRETWTQGFEPRGSE